jgi:hypothetical protein
MLIPADILEENASLRADIAIVGSGPAGIVLALELEKFGYSIAIIESGLLTFKSSIQRLGDAAKFDPNFHASMSECTRLQLGGTSNIWGGRCVPYDPVDFDQRNYIADSIWPIGYEEISRYFQKACNYFFCGDSKFNIHNIPYIQQTSIIPNLPDGEVLTSSLERWSLPTNFGKEYFSNLKNSKLITVYYGLTCTKIKTEKDKKHVSMLNAKTLSRKHIEVIANQYILASGGLNTTRLMLDSDEHCPGGIGNHSGMLGRFYMGHLSGEIASACFTTPPEKTVFNFDKDSAGIYLRRRFSFSRKFLHEKELTNIVSWLGTPKFGNPNHGSGILSAAYLALTAPIISKYLAAKAIRDAAVGLDQKELFQRHFKNVIFDLNNTLKFVPIFAFRRYISKRKIPALFIYNMSNEYPLHYHAEQVPNYNSRVTLSKETDDLGRRRLDIDLRYSKQDVNSVVRAHQYWDEYLRKHDCGYLKYFSNDPYQSVWEQASDGYHQNGTTRMSEASKDGVVTPDCRVHGFDNLNIASSSIFVTSGQANSTFMIIAFALRLADFIKKELRH